MRVRRGSVSEVWGCRDQPLALTVQMRMSEGAGEVLGQTQNPTDPPTDKLRDLGQGS